MDRIVWQVINSFLASVCLVSPKSTAPAFSTLLVDICVENGLRIKVIFKKESNRLESFQYFLYFQSSGTGKSNFKHREVFSSPWIPQWPSMPPCMRWDSLCICTVDECTCSWPSLKGLKCTDVSFRFHLLHQWNHWNFPGCTLWGTVLTLTGIFLLSRKGHSTCTHCIRLHPSVLDVCASLQLMAKTEL